MPSRESFYLHLAGTQRGPYTVPQIDHLLHSGLIGEETLYWREGLDHWEPVTALVALRKPPKLWRRFILPGAILIPILLLLGLFGPPLIDGWREATAHRFTTEDAYWRARDAVRQQGVPEGGIVSFQRFKTARVELSEGSHATAVLQGEIALGDGKVQAASWRVHLPYDADTSEWQPGRVELVPAS